MAEGGERHHAPAKGKDTIHNALCEKDNSDRKDIKQDEDEGGVTSCLMKTGIENVQRPVLPNSALRDETSDDYGENYSRAQSSIPDSNKQIDDAETGPCNRLSGRDQHPSVAETNAAARSSEGVTAAGKDSIHIPQVKQDEGVRETVAGQHLGATSASGKTESGGSPGSTLGKARASCQLAERSNDVTVATASPAGQASAPFAGSMTQSPSRRKFPGHVTASDNAKLMPEKPDGNDSDTAKSKGARPKRRTDGKQSHQQNPPEETRSQRRYRNSRNPMAASGGSTPTEYSSSNESSATTKANPAPATTKSSMKKSSTKTASRTTHSTTDPTDRKNRSKPNGSKQPLASSNLQPCRSEQSKNTTDEIVNSTQTARNGDRPKKSEEGLNDSEGAGNHIPDCDSRPGGETGSTASAVETVGPTTSTPQSMTPEAVETVGPTTSTPQSVTPEAVVGPTTSTPQSMTPEAVETVGPTTSTPQSVTPEAVVGPTTSTPQSMTPEAVETVGPTTSTPQSVTPEAVVGPTTSTPQSMTPEAVVGPTTSTQQSMTPEAVVGPTTSTPQSMTPEAVETVGPTTSTPQSMTPEAVVGPTTSTPQSMTPEAVVGPTTSTQQSMTPEAVVGPTTSTQQSMTPEAVETVVPTPSPQQSWPTRSPTAAGPTDQQGGPAHLGPQHMASSEGTRAVAGRHSWPSTQRSQSSRIPSSALSSATPSAASLASLSTASSATSSTASSTTSSTASSATSSTVSPSPPAIDLSGHVLRLHIRGDMTVEEAAMPVDSGQYSTCWDLRTGQEDRTEHRDLPVTFTLDQRLLLGDGGPRRTREIMGVGELQLYPQEQPVEEQGAEGDSTPALGQLFSSTNPTMPYLIQVLGWNADRGPGEGQQRHGADRGPGDGEQGHGADRGPGDGQPGHGAVRLCLQCRVRRANVLIFNCHHRSLCQHCVDRVEHCPWCHRPIVMFYRLDL